MTQLPDGWVTASLQEVADLITDGDHNPPKRVHEGVPHLTARNVKGGHLVLDRCSFVSHEDFDRSRRRYAPLAGDVIITCVGTLGQTAIVPKNLSFSADRNLAAIRPGKAILSPFLKAMMDSPIPQGVIRKGSGSTAQPHLYLGDIRALRIPVPPLDEQKRIIAAIEEQFSRLDVGVAALERARQNLKRMRAAVLHAAVSGALIGVSSKEWEEATLGDLLDSIHAGKSFKCAERPSNLDEWGVVKVSAMTWGEFREGENKTVVGDRTVDPRFEIRPGDLLVSRANTVEYVGAAVLVGKCRPRLLLSDKSLRLVPNSRALPEWLLISLRTSSARRYIESVATGTSDSMRNISQPKLKALQVTVPPIQVQEHLVTEVDRMMLQVEQLEKSLGENSRSAQALRSSILAAAFFGQLTPQDQTEEPALAFLQRIATEKASSNGRRPTKGRKPRVLREEVPV